MSIEGEKCQLQGTENIQHINKKYSKIHRKISTKNEIQVHKTFRTPNRLDLPIIPLAME